MDKTFMDELNHLLEVANELSLCSLKKCSKTAIKVKENKQIMSDMMKMITTNDQNIKKTIIDKISTDKDILANEVCIYTHCSEIYKKLINIFISIIEKFKTSLPNHPVVNPSNGLLKILEEIKELVNKKTLSKAQLTKLHKNKNILFFTIMNSRT